MALSARRRQNERKDLWNVEKVPKGKKNFGVVPDVISSCIFVSFFTILSILHLLLFWYLWYYRPHSMRNFHALQRLQKPIFFNSMNLASSASRFPGKQVVPLLFKLAAAGERWGSVSVPQQQTKFLKRSTMLKSFFRYLLQLASV